MKFIDKKLYKVYREEETYELHVVKWVKI